MASLIESVRKLHGPTLVEHDNGYDVDAICPECTRLRTEALEQASRDGDAGNCTVELAHVSYPCPTRVLAGTSAAEGKDESARMRLDHLVVQREQLEERMERLDAVIGLIRRDLGEITSESPAPKESAVEKHAKSSTAKATKSDWDTVDEPMSPDPGATTDDADGYEF